MIDREKARTTIRVHLLDGAEARKATLEQSSDTIIRAADTIAEKVKAGGKLLIAGNGGSAADAQHFATEFMCRLTADYERPAIPAIALTTDTSFLTAYPNDYGFAGIFERQVEALGQPGDVFIGISTSGASENVLRAVELCKRRKITTIALCGARGTLLEKADIAISVPAPNSQHVQEAHLAVEHLICHLVERALYPKA